MAKRRGRTSGQARRRKPASSNWALGRRRAPFVIEQPQADRPDLLMLLDVGADWMVATEVVADGSPGAVAGWAAPQLEPGIAVRVEEEVLAAALRARVAAGVDVVVAPTPEIDCCGNASRRTPVHDPYVTARVRVGRGARG